MALPRLGLSDCSELQHIKLVSRPASRNAARAAAAVWKRRHCRILRQAVKLAQEINVEGASQQTAVAGVHACGYLDRGFPSRG